MTEFWEKHFSTLGAIWKFEPADSAMAAIELFGKEGFRNILIPGFGYGRNAKAFIDRGFSVTGIEISASAIQLARENGIRCTVHHGSVNGMPFDNECYDAIFCYALLHLFNQHERRDFLKACYSQLRENGLMVFVVTSVLTQSYGTGSRLSKNRFRMENGPKVFFYDDDAVAREFGPFGLIQNKDVQEPIKFMENHDPMNFKYIVCRKKKDK